ncbi:hypothetical protein L218DRAFT_768355 [Marasmius fiardii PR-910]|nr:hypothetical protein L218DRAFT_768355 [Marasmius fiardii PR-910]
MEAELLEGLEEWSQEANKTKSGNVEDAEDGSDSDDESSSSSSSSSGEEDAGEDGEDAGDAEEMSRRLGEQLWEEITKAKALEATPAPTPATTGKEIATTVTAARDPPPTLSVAPAVNSPSRKQESVIATVRMILSLLEKDPVAHSALVSTTVPLPTSVSVFDALKGILAAGRVSKELAGTLSQSLVTLAQSETLFGKLRQSNQSSRQPDLGKRKRDHEQDEGVEAPHKKRAPVSFDLYGTVSEAVRVVYTTLHDSIGKGANPSLISSLQLPLHQIFLFAVTSSARGGPENSMLQEISGLIQVLAVLSDIPIGQILGDGSDKESPDIGTAVYPCTVAGCRKTFTRLFSLRTHQRVHSSDRPYVCNVCPAAFVRSHDLKRHSRVHGGKVWKCVGCNKVFSRRDAIKRHRNAAETRGPKGEACARAEPTQIETTDPEEDRTEKRAEQPARTWGDHAAGNDGGEGEEGEIPPHVIQNIQATVLQLHYVLQAYVTSASGNPVTPAPMPNNPTVGQATLASVIARAQSQKQAPPNEVQTPAPTTSMLDSASTTDTAVTAEYDAAVLPSLSMYGLSEEQTKMLEEAITNAALAAQAQAEAEAALEEEDSDDSDSDEDAEGSPDEDDTKSMLPAPQ